MQAADRLGLLRRPLGLSRMGLGTAAIADLYRQVPERAAVQTVHAALDAGITYFDTAPHYALGVAEQRLGRALAGVDRSSYVVSTKVGRLLVPGPPQSGWLPARQRQWDFSAAGVRRSLHESLQRLQLDRVDIAYIHDPDAHLDQAMGEALPALTELRAQGAVRAIGVGMADPAALARFVATGELDVILVAGRYTLLDQSALASLLPLCTQHSVGVVIGGVYNSGLLADPRPGARFDYRAAPPDALARAQALQAICRGHGVSLKAAALQFPFGHPAVRCVLSGSAGVDELRENIAELEHPVPPAVWADMLRAGLLPPGTPVPDGSLMLGRSPVPADGHASPPGSPMFGAESGQLGG